MIPKDVAGRPLKKGQVVVRVKSSGGGYTGNLEIKLITDIKPGQPDNWGDPTWIIYLDNAKVGTKFPNRLAIIKG